MKRNPCNLCTCCEADPGEEICNNCLADQELFNSGEKEEVYKTMMIWDMKVCNNCWYGYVTVAAPNLYRCEDCDHVFDKEAYDELPDEEDFE